MFLLWPTLPLVFYGLPDYFSPVLRATSWRVYRNAIVYCNIGLLKKIDKDQFLLICSILSIIDKNFNLSIVINFYQFFDKGCIFWENGKITVSGAQVSFEEKGISGDENEYNLFYGKWGFEYFFI